jgi:hypothetical protein
MKPLISVLIQHKADSPEYVESVQSVLDQTYMKFELLLIPETSGQMLPPGLSQDPRIRLLHSIQPLETPDERLNFGISQAKGEYIAIQEISDISLPTRFSEQCEYLQTHPDVEMVTSWFQYIDTEGHPIRYEGQWIAQFPVESDVLEWQLLFMAPICHSSLMYRKSSALAIGGYQPYATGYAFDFICRMQQRAPLVSLPKVLLCHRYQENHPLNLSGTTELIALAKQHLWQGRYALKPDDEILNLIHLYRSLVIEERSLGQGITPAGLSDEDYQIHEAIALYLTLYKRFLSERNPTEHVQRKIQQDAAMHLAVLLLRLTHLWEKPSA